MKPSSFDRQKFLIDPYERKCRVDAKSDVKIGCVCIYMKMKFCIVFCFTNKSATFINNISICISIPNVAPGHLRSVKHPGTVQTA